MTTQLPNGYEAVKVPEDRHIKKDSFFINNVNYLRYTYFTGKDGKHPCSSGVDLPNGNYALLGRADELTEEQVKDVVESYTQTVGWRSYDKGEELPTITAYMNYGIRKPVPVTFLFFTALESFRSLLASLHLEPHTTIILKKENV